MEDICKYRIPGHKNKLPETPRGEYSYHGGSYVVKIENGHIFVAYDPLQIGVFKIVGNVVHFLDFGMAKYSTPYQGNPINLKIYKRCSNCCKGVVCSNVFS